VEKQWSLSGFQFKGEGWYVTDYAGKKGGSKEDKAASDSKEKSSPVESTASTDTASKPTSDSSAKSEGSKK